jgi:FkbM family methyltransferase
LAIVAGLLLNRAVSTGWPAVIKLRGNAPDCTWERIGSIHAEHSRFGALSRSFSQAVSVRQEESGAGIELVSSPGRAFWLRKSGKAMNGAELLAYLLAEHHWVAEMQSGQYVRPGDTVLDCGAHVGVFTYMALRHGAARVIAVEPDPINAECFRSNFQREISAGRVVLVPEGVWSKQTELDLSQGVSNSGTSGVVAPESTAVIKIRVNTIDNIIGNIGLSKLDFVKMDIEGAEREALAGAQETLRRFRPRLMLDTYHRPDDPAVLRRLIHRANPAYVEVCGPCEQNPQTARIIPHVTFFH